MPRTQRILLLGLDEQATLDVCRSLGRAGHHVAVLRLTPGRTLADNSRFCAQSVSICASGFHLATFASELAAFLEPGAYDYLLPIDAPACEIMHFAHEAIGARIAVVWPGHAAYAAIRDQLNALALACSVGFGRPPTVVSRQGAALPPITLPCFVKPVHSHVLMNGELQSLSTRRVVTMEALDAKLRDDHLRSDVMLQAPIIGRRVTLSFCAIDGRLAGASIVEAAVDAHSHSKVGRPTAEALARMQAIASELHWTGFLTIECREAEEKLWVMRLACRPPRDITLSARAGVDFPSLLLAALTAERHDEVVLPVQKARSRLALSLPDDPQPAIERLWRVAHRGWNKAALRLAAMRIHRGARPNLHRESAILVVCQGNINRSLVTEQLLKSAGFTRVRSAGLLGMSGRRPSRQAEDYLRARRGIDASGLRSQSLSSALRADCGIDAVLCFERRQVVEIARRFPQLRGRTFLMSAAAIGGEQASDIADPHGRSDDEYAACFRRIERLVEGLVAAADR
jgi:protein-tyrosine-phosphatase